MKEFGRLTLVATLFCLSFLQWGCLKSSKSGVFNTENAVRTSYKAPSASGPYERAVNESARDIPVAYDVDVVVVGGSSGAVVAAVEAAQKGAKVFLAAQRPYLGEDLCGTYRLWLEPDEAPTSPLAKCKNKDVPNYSQQQVREWIEQGFATAGGPGNTAPLMARTGLKVAVGVNLGRGNYDGLDAQGKFFYDVMTENGIDMSQTHIHPNLPTGTTFIHSTTGEDRGGIAYFPSANDDFDFEIFKGAVERLKPNIVYYVYSGLSERGDANGGRDLAEFIKWCRSKDAVTIVDSHTLTSNPHELIEAGRAVEQYWLLEPLLPEVDLFFTSCDEAKLVENTLAAKRAWNKFGEHENNLHSLDFLTERFWQKDNRTKLFGVTVSNGAYEKHICSDAPVSGPNKIESRFMAGEVVDLVGAGDSFRAGLITYIARNLDEFRNGSMNFAEAVQMGNLFASLYIKAPLDDRYGGIRPYDKMLKVVRSGVTYQSFDALQKALS